MAKVNAPAPTAEQTALAVEPPNVATQAGLVAPAPDFLAPVKGRGIAAGTEGLAQYIRPPRVKIVQKQALPPLSDMFDKGDVVIAPDNILLAPVQKNANNKPGDFGERFYFTPLLFYPEWCRWNPFAQRGSVPAISERSTDPKSRIAKLASNAAMWVEKHPDKPDDPNWNIRNVEHLNFWILLHTGPKPYQGEFNPVVMSFSRGQHRDGTAFAGLLSRRKVEDICGCVFEGRTAHRPDKGKGDWYGIDVTNPGEEAREAGFGPWITDNDWYQAAKEFAGGLRHAYRQQIAEVAYDDDDVLGAGDVIDGRATSSEY